MTAWLVRRTAAAVFISIVCAAVAEAQAAAIQPYLQIRGQSAPAFSPRAERIAYSWSITGLSQVWQSPAAGGFPAEVSFGSERALFKAWSPLSSDTLLFGRDRGGDENAQLYAVHPDGSQLRDLTPGETSVRHELGGFSFDGTRLAIASNKRNSAFFDVYVLEVASGRQTLVYQADSANYPAAWSHDGRKLLVNNSHDNFDNDLTLVDLETGRTKLLTAHSGQARFESPHFSADDRTIYCTSDSGGREFIEPAALDVASGRIRFFSTAQSDVEELVLSRDGRRMAFVRNNGGYGQIYVEDVASQRAVAGPHLPPGVVSDLVFDNAGTALAFTFSGSAYPPAIWRYDIAAKSLHEVTQPSLGGVAPQSFVTPRLIAFTSFDGRQIPAWYYTPKGAGAKIPVVVNVHGGPESQYRPDFDAITQYFLARGYGVLAPNVRGSSGYGRTYLHLADVRRREDSVKDLHAAYQWLVSSGGADPKRVALYGGSYGGYMVLGGLTLFPDDWAAGVDIVGIANWVTFLENTSAYRRTNREATYGSLERDRDFLASISPIHRADRIKAPLIIFMGANDPRVPANEGVQMAAALKARNVPVDLTVFPNEGHGIARYENRVSAYTRIADFLDRYIGGQTSAQR
jgi:dipeptidyl aminopeptidase/acylaminoacyl peptidase